MGGTKTGGGGSEGRRRGEAPTSLRTRHQPPLFTPPLTSHILFPPPPPEKNTGLPSLHPSLGASPPEHAGAYLQVSMQQPCSVKQSRSRHTHTPDPASRAHAEHAVAMRLAQPLSYICKWPAGVLRQVRRLCEERLQRRSVTPACWQEPREASGMEGRQSIAAATHLLAPPTQEGGAGGAERTPQGQETELAAPPKPALAAKEGPNSAGLQCLQRHSPGPACPHHLKGKLPLKLEALLLAIHKLPGVPGSG